MQHINLEEFSNRALTMQVNRAFEEVVKNIQNPNTDATAKRKITVTLTFKPNEERTIAPCDIQAKTTLAPIQKSTVILGMGKDIVTGEVDCMEVGNQIPGQLSFTNSAEEEQQEFDHETGEIYEDSNTSNVIDLRSAK